MSKQSRVARATKVDRPSTSSSMSLAPPFALAEERHEILRSMAKVIDGRHRLWHEHNLNDLEDEVYARIELHLAMLGILKRKPVKPNNGPSDSDDSTDSNKNPPDGDPRDKKSRARREKYPNNFDVHTRIWRYEDKAEWSDEMLVAKAESGRDLRSDPLFFVFNAAVRSCLACQRIALEQLDARRVQRDGLHL
ncbi:uncharacterized protein K489DRAFT_428827 [Dissoconium aciculare CBS 342.82]|uniref:Uncharacterized protein n=1 Tax=Dissoconium aciculare CBS 342.82 TaxID=1314786 RepID=A0A6J3MHU8_9PEZI|nr:uncharacterized protein K489DRAFT_428827 [Dissoconium aciculare CBS 342.82]KAF1826467.1 hypothetical protein K489DRAFT_428827 [Dissoconium aciculare CBS 342.82]